MKKYYLVSFLILTLTACQKTKEEVANKFIQKFSNEASDEGTEVEIVKTDPLVPAQLSFDETEKGISIKQSIDKLQEETHEQLQFIKPWAQVTDVSSDLKEINQKIKEIQRLENSLTTARKHFKYDTTMLMKPVIIKIREKGQVITDTAYFFFDKQVKRCTGIKAREKGVYQYIETPILVPIN